jgi:hypothetical protein
LGRALREGITAAMCLDPVHEPQISAYFLPSKLKPTG